MKDVIVCATLLGLGLGLGLGLVLGRDRLCNLVSFGAKSNSCSDIGDAYEEGDACVRGFACEMHMLDRGLFYAKTQ